MSLNKYRELRHRADIIVDNGGFILRHGEMNPHIVNRFIDRLERQDAKDVWEPFANPDGRTFAAFEEAEISLVATSLMQGHLKITEMDATRRAPDGNFDGILFHPPYFGSSRFTTEERDLSNMDRDDWMDGMNRTANFASKRLRKGGLVCVVGRRYRYGGEEMRLDEWMIEAFSGMDPEEVWRSEPDIVIILRNKK